jgi:hypothetical protein
MIKKGAKMSNEFSNAVRQEVEERYPDIEFPYARREPIWYGRRKHRMVGEKIGIVVNYKDEDFLSYLASPNYKIVQYQEIIWRTERAMERLEEFGAPTPHIEIIQQGRKFNYELKFKDCDPVKIRDGHEVHPNIMIKASHDGMWEYQINSGAIAFVCTNGLVVGESAYMEKRKHLTGLNIEAIADTMEKSMEAFSTETGIWKQWAERQLTAPEWAEVQEDLPFGKKQLPAVLSTRLDGAGYSLNEYLKDHDGPNVWDLLMASTQYLRDVDSPLVRINKTNQVTSVLHSLN